MKIKEIYKQLIIPQLLIKNHKNIPINTNQSIKLNNN